MQNDAYTTWVNTIWCARTAERKEHLSKMSLGTPTCIKEESKPNVLGLSLYYAHGLLVIKRSRHLTDYHVYQTVKTTNVVV